MIEEVGTVVEVRAPGVVIVRCEKHSMCGHCASSALCHLGSDGQVRLVEAGNPLGASVGEQVRVAVSTRAFLQSALVLYGVPLFGLLLGAVGGNFLGPRLYPGVAADLYAAGSAMTLLVASFVSIRLLSRRLPAEAFRPQIVAILDDDRR